MEAVLSGASGRRLWIYRLTALFAAPCVVLLVLEIGLRTARFGHPTAFFLRQEIKGTNVLISNPSFGLSYFPPGLARSPLPLITTVKPASNVFRIILFGESAAMGDPRPAFGMGRLIETLLNERFPGKKFEVVSTAMTAINSHAVRKIAEECTQYPAQAWVVYMGNNEMAGPFGANTIFGAQAPPVAAVRAYLRLQETRTGQLMASILRTVSPAAAPSAWEGLKMFESNQLPPEDPRKQRVYANFQQNLDAILQAAQRAKVHVFLSTVASNLRDCAPFGSLHNPVLTPERAEAWQHQFQAATELEQSGHGTEASARFAELIGQSPRFAEAHFRLARCNMQSGHSTEGKSGYVIARDFDSLPFRADSTINRLIQNAGQRWAQKEVLCIDGEQILAAMVADNVPGAEFFYEHVHLKFEANYWLARAFAEKITRALTPEWTGNNTAEWASSELCAQRLGLTAWNRIAALEEMIQRISEPPFVHQANHVVHRRRLSQELADLRLGLTSEGHGQARPQLDDALRRRPDDPWLRQSYAEFLSSSGDWASATVQMRTTIELLPYHHSAYLQLGRLLVRQKRYDEARAALEQASERRPDLTDARLELARVCAAQERFAEAFDHLAHLEKLHPKDDATHLVRARILVQLGRRADAITSLRSAIGLRPTSWEARYLLGLQLILEHQFEEARTEFETVVAQRPEYALAHLNLGFALAKLERFDAAAGQFQETLKLDPENEQARQFLKSILPHTTPTLK